VKAFCEEFAGHDETWTGTVDGTAFFEEVFGDGVGADDDEGVKGTIFETENRAILLVPGVVLAPGMGRGGLMEVADEREARGTRGKVLVLIVSIDEEASCEGYQNKEGV